MFQSDGPPVLFAPIDHHHDLRLARLQIGGLAQCDEIRTDLGQRVRSTFHKQKELDFR